MANSAVFLFQIMLARITVPAMFGQVVALLGVLMILEAPASSVQALISKAIQRNTASEGSTPGAPDLGALIPVALLVGLILGLALLPLMVELRSFLHLDASPFLLTVFVLPVTLNVVPKGVLAGFGDFRSLSVGLMTSAVVRLVAGTLLVHAGYGINGAIGAVVIGEAVGGTWILAAMRRHTSSQGAPLALSLRDASGEGLAFTGFWLMTGLDVVVAQHYLRSGLAGEYAAAATLAQLVMILPSASAGYLLPRLTGASSGRHRTGRLLARGVFGVAAVSVAVAVSVEALVRPVIQGIFDRSYLGAVAASWPLLLSAVCLSLVFLLMQYLLNRQEEWPAALTWVGVIAFIAVTAFNHQTMTAIADSALAAAGATAGLMLMVAVHGVRYLHRADGVGPDLAGADAELDLTVVIPYYNPGAALAPNLRRVIDVLDASHVDFEVIAVSDGSTDGSDTTIRDFDDGRLRQVSLRRNQGKGAALRVGLAMGRGRYLGFIDADGDLDPMILDSFVTLARLYDPDIVVGSKRHPLSSVRYPPLRWVYSIGFQCLTRSLFRLTVRDTQTGIKLVRRDVLASALPRMLEKRFAFDLELLVVARRLGYRRFMEAPVTLHHQFKSTVSTRSVVNTLIDALAIFYRLRFLRTYDRPPSMEELCPPVLLSPAFIRDAVHLGSLRSGGRFPAGIKSPSSDCAP